MPRETFYDSLRIASRTLVPPKADTGQGANADAYYTSVVHRADLWLTPKSVEGFEEADFADWPKKEREALTGEVRAFLNIAEQVPSDQPATTTQSKQGRKHLEKIIEIVGRHVVNEWLEAQRRMLGEAMSAARSKGWHVEMDTKPVLESLLGRYDAPRLRIRTPNSEVVLDPVARFGAGRQGVVDLVVMPTYETRYLVTFRNGRWQIISPRGAAHSRPFTQATLVNTITALSRF